MTDVEIAEQALAVLHEKLHVATRRSHEISADRQRLSYAAFVDNDPSATADLEKLRHRGAELADEVLNIKSAIVHADACLVAAKVAVAQTEAQVHINRVNEMLTAVQELAPQMDVCWGKIVKGSAGGYRHEVGPKNGPLFVKVGNLVGEINNKELKALGLDRAAWSMGIFDVMHISDFRTALEKLAQAYQHGRPTNAHNFVELVANWSASVKASILAQHEQTDNAGRVAA